MITTNEPFILRGPRHLISNLDVLDIDQSTAEQHYLWLDDDYAVIGHTHSPGETVTANNCIIVVVDPENTWSERVTDVENMMDQCASAHVLDVLLVHQRTWRSLLCKDETCCPTTGIPFPEITHHDSPQRRALFAQWQAWLVTGNIPASSLQMALSSLKDLPLRDALLANLAADPDALDRWLTLEVPDEALHSAPFLSIRASVHFLREDRDQTADLLTEALDIDPQYSLAKLLVQAIDSSAPRSIVLTAFTRYSSEELLERATSDINVTDVKEVKEA